MNAKYDQYVSRKARELAGTEHDLDTSELWPQFVDHFQGRRVRVTRTYSSGETETRTGTVSVTSGWRPAFLLMHRSSDRGSSDVLSDKDVVTHVQYGRTYVPVSNLYRKPYVGEY